MFFGTLFTLPNASTTLEGLGDYASPIVSDFMPVVYVVGGISLGIFLILMIIKAVHSLHDKK